MDLNYAGEGEAAHICGGLQYSTGADISRLEWDKKQFHLSLVGEKKTELHQSKKYKV